MPDGFNETPVRGLNQHGVDVPESSALAVLPAIATAAPGVYPEGTLVGLSTDLDGALRVALGDTDGFDVDVVDRAERILGITALDAATIAAIRDVNDTVTLAEGSTVALDAATLAALENTSVTVSNALALDAATIAALADRNDEVTFAPGSTVALSPETLAALEDVTSTVTGTVTVEPGAAPLAVEVGNFPAPVANQDVTVTNDVTLSAATITALNEGNDSVTIAAPVALDAATLAALESTTATVVNGADPINVIVTNQTEPTGNQDVTVTNAVALDAATIAALADRNDEVTFAAGSTVALSAETLAALETTTVSVSNFPAPVDNQDVTVTNAVALDTATLDALTAPVEGQVVALDAASLTALENTTVTVAAPIALDAATLAALNDGNDSVAISNFPAVQDVTGTVALDAGSLAALEDITATVTGTVALDAATLAALETTTVGGTVTVEPGAAPLAVTVDNFPAAVDNQDVTVTNAVALDAATIAALADRNDEVTFAPGSTVALDAASLAALETTTADISDRAGRILGDVTVTNFPAAVENQDVTVTNPVALDAASLAALETIALDATTLAALETVDLNAATISALNDRALRVGNADASVANPVPVTLIGTAAGLTPVDSGLLRTQNLAPGATTVLDGPIAAAFARLTEVTASSSVRIRIEIRENGTARRVFFSDPVGMIFTYEPAQGALDVPTGQRFSVAITNLDNRNTADVYASISQLEG